MAIHRGELEVGRLGRGPTGLAKGLLHALERFALAPMNLDLNDVLVAFTEFEKVLDCSAGVVTPLTIGTTEVGNGPGPQKGFAPSLNTKRSQEPLHLDVTLPKLDLAETARATDGEGLLEHDTGLVMKTASDDLGRMRKVGTQAMRETLRQQVVCVPQTTKLASVVETGLFENRADLLEPL